MLNPIIAELHNQVLSESTAIRHHRENTAMLRVATVQMLRDLSTMNGNYLQSSLYHYLLDMHLYPAFVNRLHDFYIYLALTRDMKDLDWPPMHEVLYQHIGNMFKNYTQQGTLETYNDIFKGLSLFRAQAESVPATLANIKAPTIIGKLTVVLSGLMYGYPSCCILEHVLWRDMHPGSPDGAVPRAAARKRTKTTNATAWWEGTGYVPCESCGRHAEEVESQHELLNAISQKRITPVLFETKNLR